MFNNKNKLVHLALAIFLTALMANGCRSKLDDLTVRMGKVGDPAMAELVRKNVAAMGGADLLNQNLMIQAESLVSVSQDDGGKMLIQQKHEVYLQGKRVVLTSLDAGQEVVEKLTIDLRDRNAAPADPAQLQNYYGSVVKMALEYYSVSGLYGLLDEGVTFRYLGNERKGGSVFHKIQADGLFIKQRARKELAIKDSLIIWINADTNLVDRIIMRYIDPIEGKAYRFLAVNVRDFKPQELGLMVPGYIAYVPGDEFEQFSEKNLLTVEYQRVTVKQLDKK